MKHSPDPQQVTVFVVDDEEENRDYIEACLAKEGYTIVHFQNGQEVLSALADGENDPDLILLDIMMPGLDGFEVCRRIRAYPDYERIPILMVTGLEDVRAKVSGLKAGADDYIPKPFNPSELRARVHSQLRLKFLGDELEYKNRLLENEKLHLETLVRERTKELKDITLGVVATLERANALKDIDTGKHILRVSAYSYLLGKGLGLPPSVLDRIERYASLHDVGKVGIPDSLLRKTTGLTAREFEIVKKHTIYGYHLLRLAKADPMAMNIALFHHERYDGKGYPYGLKRDRIPLEARIVTLADVFDALTTSRPYKSAYSFDESMKTIESEAGTAFDPKLVEIHLDSRDDLYRIYTELRDRCEEEEFLSDELPPTPPVSAIKLADIGDLKNELWKELHESEDTKET